MPCLSPNSRIVPANKSSSQHRPAFKSCRIEGMPLGSSASIIASHFLKSSSVKVTPSACATAITSRMAALNISRASPACCTVSKVPWYNATVWLTPVFNINLPHSWRGISSLTECGKFTRLKRASTCRTRARSALSVVIVPMTNCPWSR